MTTTRKSSGKLLLPRLIADINTECWRVPEKVWKGLPDPDVCDDAALFEAALLGMNQVSGSHSSHFFLLLQAN